MDDQLAKYRKLIDGYDEQIIRAISERAAVAQKIADLKKETGTPIFRPGREKEVYRKVNDLNKGPLQSRHIEAIYREIMSSIIDLEGAFEVCYLGPKASFTHQAAVKKFGSSLGAEPLETIPDIFRAVEREEFRYGVVPIENSTEGVVTNTLDQFIVSDLKIYSEIYLRIHLCLMVPQDNKSIKEIYSHRQGLAQSREWLRKEYPKAELIETSSTSKAAKMLKGRKNAAAIASELAAGLYGLRILSKGIEDNPKNMTRFLIIGKDQAPPTGEDKTSLVCSLSDQPGALFSILEPFAKSGINLTRIESRPNRRENWEYNFFIDLKGHRDDDQTKKVIDELTHRTTFIKVLGSFPDGSGELT